MDVCSCEACTRIGELKLKQVVHTGNVDFEKINNSEKLFGVDVIVVHRMLKNSVPSQEYVMMTDHAHSNFVDFYGLQPERFKENFKGIGEVDTVVFYPDEIIKKKEGSEPDVSGLSNRDRMKWKFTLLYDTIRDLFRIKKIRGSFNNIPG